MTDFPPLPRYLTLEDAAQALTDRTGKAWTPRQILGCAERHQIFVFARIGHAVKFVRVKPIDGRTNEIAADEGSVPRLDTEAIRALLLTGEARSRGWEELTTVDFFGGPAEVWQIEFELAPGQEAPIVRPDVCRVTAGGVLQLVDTFTRPAPVQNPATPAPVVEMGASGGVKPDKAGQEDGLLTIDIAVTFDGVNGWNAERWRKNLSASKWLHPARIALGGAGGASSVWNPLTLAQLMHSKTKDDKAKGLVMTAFNSRFTLNPVLMPWRADFNEYFATYCTTD